ncbi:MAG: hypothetical protein EBU90_25375 [Proteobacteria bacterium]|nr:hypothetical protein [Pseudomonadota bacterium]
MSEYTEENPLVIEVGKSPVRPVMAGDIIKLLGPGDFWLYGSICEVRRTYTEYFDPQFNRRDPSGDGVWAVLDRIIDDFGQRRPSHFNRVKLYALNQIPSWERAVERRREQQAKQQYRAELEAQIPTDHDILGIKDLFNEL